MVGTTIPHEVREDFAAAKVMLKPASKGTGVIAGGAVRAVVEAAGHPRHPAEGPRLTNPVNVTRATLNALRRPAHRRGARAASAASGSSLAVPGQPRGARRLREVADAR
jgi:small subunit ribosomal protein S5